MFSIKELAGAALLAGLMLLGPAIPQAHARFFVRGRPRVFNGYNLGLNLGGPLRQSTLPVYSSGVNPQSPFYNPLMPTYRASPGTSMQQAMYNTYAPLQAAATLPPWMYGYNPYPPPVYYSPSPYVPMYAPYAPSYSNPYAGLNYYAPSPYSSSAFANPYSAGY